MNGLRAKVFDPVKTTFDSYILRRSILEIELKAVDSSNASAFGHCCCHPKAEVEV